MAKSKTRKRTVVGSPLTPELLKELRAFDGFPPAPKDFDPNGNWANTYRIWTCHGYRESGNQSVGFIKITRSRAEAESAFGLEIYQEVVEVDGMLNTIDARMICLNDQLASPIKWLLYGHFVDPYGQDLNELRTMEEIEVRDNGMIIRAGDRTFARGLPRRVTSNWCLFEAIQRLKFDEKSSLDFNMLEGLSLLKKNQRLLYRGVYPTRLGGEEVSLHRFDQLGAGILPYEYWLDESHRLLLVTSLNKAYILDNKAEATIRQRTEQLRGAYQRTRSAKRK